MLSSSGSLFLRQVSRKKLERLAKLAHKDPAPLFCAVRCGFFNSIRKPAIEVLKIEQEKAKYEKVKDDFQKAIDLL